MRAWASPVQARMWERIYLVAMDWPMRARGPRSTRDNMHSNAASRDCNGIGDCKQERTFVRKACPARHACPTRRFAGKARLLRKARPSVLGRHALRQACGRGVPEWSRVPVVRDSQPC